MTLLLYRNYYYAGNAAGSVTGLLPIAAAGGRGRSSPRWSRPAATRRIGGRRWVDDPVRRCSPCGVPALCLPYRPALTVAAAAAASAWSPRASRSSPTPRCRSRPTTTSAAGSSASTTPRTTCSSWPAVRRGARAAGRWARTGPVVAVGVRLRRPRRLVRIASPHPASPRAAGSAERRDARSGVSPRSAAQARSSATASSWLERTPVQAELLEVAPGLADQRSRRHAEQLHDRVAVEVGAHPGQVLLGGDPVDPLLEGVVVGRERRAPCAGCGWCSRTGSACAAAAAVDRRR